MLHGVEHEIDDDRQNAIAERFESGWLHAEDFERSMKLPSSFSSEALSQIALVKNLHPLYTLLNGVYDRPHLF